MSVVFVHIGLPKTGTTHLQDRLWRNRDLALKAGLLYPGDAIDDHFHAAAHLQPERYLDWVDPEHAQAWPTMIAQMKAWPGTSLVSHELLATANREQIAQFVGALDFADEVHVVVTVRDLARQLPSAWQENVKNQRRGTFDEFVAAVADRAGSGDLGHGEEGPFWEFQDYVRILDDWSGLVEPERIHVVTVPREAAPGDGLWERFVGVLGVDPATLSAPIETANSSLSAAQAEFLRQLNDRLQPSDVEWARYERVVKGELIGEVMFGAERTGEPQGLSAAQRSWATRQAETMTAELTRRGYDVVGSLDDLAVGEADEGDAQPPTQQEVLDAALDALAGWVKIAPLPAPPRRWESAARNVVRKARRRAVGVRNRARQRRSAR
ncbi:sulfotransferase family protein [Gordonia sp. X0973]|uniref:sulfotransferase family protein n=1 Tax=Gordonia sp. X0973 TaxID=2742602 RepID=UPI000F526DE7|nr:sulfotransferase family protein [Gordonia sp. X0973]QKT07743.1 sulfotransferase family protein [Gordonia sp. X0973]